MDSNDLWLKRIRNYAGFLGMILPWLSLLGAFIYSEFHIMPGNFWSTLSISATYYITPPLTAVLTAAAIVLMCYDGYDKRDSIITTLSGVFGIMIVIFPCDCSVSPDIVGFFQLPVHVSNIMHCTAATIFFLLLAYMSMFQFTRTDVFNKDNIKKKQRNIIYRVCAIGMLSAMILMPLPVYFFAKTFIIEAVALTFFGVSWLVKGGAFTFLNDNLTL